MRLPVLPESLLLGAYFPYTRAGLVVTVLSPALVFTCRGGIEQYGQDWLAGVCKRRRA